MPQSDKKDFFSQFDQRKKDHIRISMDPNSQSVSRQFSSVRLSHNPLPELNFQDVSIGTRVFGRELKSPFFISSMTLGHDQASSLNQVLAGCAQEKGWMMGVGSQRRQLQDPKAFQECVALREKFPDLVLFGNIGLSQVIGSSLKDMESLVESLEAHFLVVHLNPLQELIQPEGTPQFAGGLEALQELGESLSVPVVVKETGCGFSLSSLEKLKSLCLGAVDLSGRGGTHWGRVEGLRQDKNSAGFQLAQTFKDWGETTMDSVFSARRAGLPFDFWASGGVRSGLDGAKLMVLGASMVGFAQPLLLAAEKGQQALRDQMSLFENELMVAMFCMGCQNLDSMIGRDELWIKNPTY